MCFASCCLRFLLILSLALGGATPALASAAMLAPASTGTRAGGHDFAHGVGCRHEHGAPVATQAHVGVMDSDAANTAPAQVQGTMHAQTGRMVMAVAQHTSQQADVGGTCCAAGNCDCACMQGVPCIVIAAAVLLTDAPVRARVIARLPDAHADPARAQLIRPPTL